MQPIVTRKVTIGDQREAALTIRVVDFPEVAERPFAFAFLNLDLIDALAHIGPMAEYAFERILLKVGFQEIGTVDSVWTKQSPLCTGQREMREFAEQNLDLICGEIDRVFGTAGKLD